MVREFYLGLAASGLRMPIGTDLVLHGHENHADILQDGRRLGRGVEQAARRSRTPLAVPLMDLTLEKDAILAACNISGAEVSFHFTEPPPLPLCCKLSSRMLATCEGIRYVARETDLMPIGMSIGPFSLATKLISDPITPVFLAGTGASSSEEPEIRLLETLVTLATDVVMQYVVAQIDAGAKAILLCEPSANTAYFSPNQLERSYGVFEQWVMAPNRRVKELLTRTGADLIFHDCGELHLGMVRRFAGLDPAILSLGSSRRLWEDASVVSKSTVLYGNLPTKKFYSDALISVDEVRRMALELLNRMQAADHPFILGSECDVLSVPGCEQTIEKKVEAFMTCA